MLQGILWRLYAAYKKCKAIKDIDGMLSSGSIEFQDDAEFPCCCCERLCRRTAVSCVDFSNVTKYQTAVWLALKAHILKNNGTEQLYICQYCQPFLNKNTIPARCVLNGLLTEPVPDELKSLDALSKQLIQRAKAFQTIVRLGTYSGKVPA